VRVNHAPALLAISNQFLLCWFDTERQLIWIVPSLGDAFENASASILCGHLRSFNQNGIQRGAVGNLFHVGDSNAKLLRTCLL
jgi:hypothetical protein